MQQQEEPRESQRERERERESACSNKKSPESPRESMQQQEDRRVPERAAAEGGLSERACGNKKSPESPRLEARKIFSARTQRAPESPRNKEEALLLTEDVPPVALRNLR